MVADPATLPDVMGDYIFSSDRGWRDLEAEYNRLLPFFSDVILAVVSAGLAATILVQVGRKFASTGLKSNGD